jgi:anthranilate synthase component 1
MVIPSKDQFLSIVRDARAAGTHEASCTLAVPLRITLLDDQLTPVLAYRRLVAPDAREAPSFLLESVEGGERQGRHSILGAQPACEIVAFGHTVRVSDHRPGGRSSEAHEPDPLDVPRRMAKNIRLLRPPEPRGTGLPNCFLGGWVGFAGYDTVRYAEPEKLDPANAPRDDRGLPDLHLGFYDGVVVFDHVDKVVHIVRIVEAAASASDAQLGEAFDRAVAALERRAAELQAHSKPLASGRMTGPKGPAAPLKSNLTREQHASMVARALEYIKAGDIFQVVIGQRFERRSRVDPFDVYRALRAVNPSPYMVYMQAQGCILVASSPEILCRVRGTALPGGGFSRTVTNRPLAGTRRRGTTPEEDKALEKELLADTKETAEHVMLVDLGRNDVGRVAEIGSVRVTELATIERYSHVMHIVSHVEGKLRPGLDWLDCLRATFPAGTLTGAPKVRAMEIIDELETLRRGPFGGCIGYIDYSGNMDTAITIRTAVVKDGWIHLQAGAGVVADSDPRLEHLECRNKAAAVIRAIDLAREGDA